jgi:hypothetical protein
VSVSADGPAAAAQMGIGFVRRRGERFLGFGERSDAVVRTGGTVQDYVAEGPYQPSEYPLIHATVPAVAVDTRAGCNLLPDSLAAVLSRLWIPA